MKLISGLRDGSAKRRHIIIIVAVGVIGTIALLTSFAATISTKFEPEGGTVSLPATVQDGATASDGKYIQFGRKGQYIIYASKKGMPTMQIWRMNADGSDPVQLTNDPNFEHPWVRPSPDGRKILFVKADAGQGVNDAGTNRLWIMNSDGSDQHEVLTKNRYGWDNLAHAEWSPDSSRIVLANGSYLTTIKLDGSDPVRIAQPSTIDGDVAYPGDPSWATDGSIMFIRKWHNCVGICERHDVFRLNLTTAQETRVTTDQKVKWDPYLSPDGKTYVWLVWPNNPFVPGALYKGNAVGGLNPTPLVDDGVGTSNGVFSSDSKTFLFIRNYNFGWIDVRHSIYQINVDGTGLARVSKETTSTDEGSPAYWP